MSQPHHLDTENSSEEKVHTPKYRAKDLLQHLMLENRELRARAGRCDRILEENVNLRKRIEQFESEQRHEKEKENTRDQASVPSKKRKIRDSDVATPDAATSDVATLETMSAHAAKAESAKTFLELIGDCHYPEDESEDDDEDAITNQTVANHINDAKRIIERFKNWTATHRKYSDAIELFHQHLEHLVIHESGGKGKFKQTKHLSLLLTHCEQRCEKQFLRVMDVYVELGAWSVKRQKREYLAMFGVPI